MRVTFPGLLLMYFSQNSLSTCCGAVADGLVVAMLQIRN